MRIILGMDYKIVDREMEVDFAASQIPDLDIQNWLFRRELLGLAPTRRDRDCQHHQDTNLLDTLTYPDGNDFFR